MYESPTTVALSYTTAKRLKWVVSHQPTSCPGKNTLIAQEARTNAQVHIAGHTHTVVYP